MIMILNATVESLFHSVKINRLVQVIFDDKNNSKNEYIA